MTTRGKGPPLELRKALVTEDMLESAAVYISGMTPSKETKLLSKNIQMPSEEAIGDGLSVLVRSADNVGTLPSHRVPIV